MQFWRIEKGGLKRILSKKRRQRRRCCRYFPLRLRHDPANLGFRLRLTGSNLAIALSTMKTPRHLFTIEALEARIAPATITVNTLKDVVDSPLSGTISLRDALTL